MHTPKNSPRVSKLVPKTVKSPDTRKSLWWDAENTTEKRIRRLKSIATQTTPTGLYNTEMDGWMGRWMDGWMDGRMDRQIDR